LLSKKTSAALIRLEPIEPEVGWKPTAEFAEPAQQLFQRGAAFYFERAAPSDLDLYVVSFLKSQRINHGSRQPDSQAVSPSCNLHDHSS
jgi:hypothetical protein